MEDTNNVTQRQKQRSNSLHDLTSYDSTLLDSTMLSIPNSSLLNESQCIIELNEKITTLSNDLKNANLEIENLNTENFRLKSDLGQALKRIEALENLITKKEDANALNIKHDFQVTAEAEKQEAALTHSEQIKNVINNTILLDHEPANKLNSKLLSANNDVVRSINADDVKKFIIIADQQGRNIRKLLQELVGPNYSVNCFWKPGARMQEVLGTCKTAISELTENDFVIILGGINDCHPREFQFCVREFCKYTTHTNVIFLEVPYNNVLREEKLNYDLRFTCSDFVNVRYIDMNYSRFFPSRNLFVVNICRSILREIVRNEYKTKLSFYYKKTLKQQKESKTTNKSTQTEDVINHCDSFDNIDRKQCSNEVPININNNNLCDEIVINTSEETSSCNDPNLFRL